MPYSNLRAGASVAIVDESKLVLEDVEILPDVFGCLFLCSRLQPLLIFNQGEDGRFSLEDVCAGFLQRVVVPAVATEQALGNGIDGQAIWRRRVVCIDQSGRIEIVGGGVDPVLRP